MKSITLLLVFILSAPGLAKAQETLTGSRDPWLWPFSQTSIWNMPIGSGAVYEPANLGAAAHVGADIQIILELKATDPERKALGSSAWGPGRCDSVNDLNFKLRVPDDWIVPDAGNSPYGLTPNSNFAFRLPNSDMVFEGSKVARCQVGGPVYFPDWMVWPNNRKQQDIKGDGLKGAGQGASGMSALGGTIRLGAWTSDEPIRHAIKINPWAEKYCYYSSSIRGFKWPAISADSYAAAEYKGTNPNIVMGTLLAIPPDVTEESLNLTTIPGKKLFFTMQNYGVYFTEDAAWDTWDIIVERDAELEFQSAFGFSMSSNMWKNELNKLIQALHVVTNNTPATIGGGGNPLQPLAPVFGNPSTNTIIEQGPLHNRINVFPNPVPNDIIHFSKTVDVEVFDMCGIMQNKFTKTQQIEIKHLTKGMYLLRIYSMDYPVQSTLIVKQ
jgi:hypothetical protein